MKTKNILWLIVLTSILTSCSSKLDVDSKYIINQEALKDSLKQKEKTLVLFWTNWCGASKQTIKDHYLPMMDSIKRNNLDLKLILLASDENIKVETIEEQRALGISAFYIEKPGGIAILNRMSIKDFINDVFPDNEMEHISKFQFGIPVELLINKELDLINEKDENLSFEYKVKILSGIFD